MFLEGKKKQRKRKENGNVCSTSYSFVFFFFFLAFETLPGNFSLFMGWEAKIILHTSDVATHIHINIRVACEFYEVLMGIQIIGWIKKIKTMSSFIRQFEAIKRN